MTFRILMIFLVLCMPQGAVSQEEDLRLAVPSEMIENGFTKHLLPRFGFKTRIKIVPVLQGEPADLSLSETGSTAPLFQSADGRDFYLEHLADAPLILEKIAKFEDWLGSDPGRAAITGFPAGGPPLYVIGEVEVAQVEEVELDGDVVLGSKLALLHCGRCHVVDVRNRMGGIGSTPSFSALRGREDWTNLFLTFWAENPHPSFTQVEDVTEPFTDARPTTIAPVEVTLDEIDAITAFVGTLTPKNLGAQVDPR